MATPDFDARLKEAEARRDQAQADLDGALREIEFLTTHRDILVQGFAMFDPVGQAEPTTAPTKRGRKPGTKTAKKATAKRGAAKKATGRKSAGDTSLLRGPLAKDPEKRAAQVAARQAAKDTKGGGGRKRPGVGSASGKEGA